MNIHLQIPKSSEQLSLDPAMPGAEKASITLSYPNGTNVTIKGDPKIVQQILDRLDGQRIDYTPPETNIEPETQEFCHLVERAKLDINVLHISGCNVLPDNKKAKCPLMDYLKDASDQELKKHMPKLGDYEANCADGKFVFSPFGKNKKVIQSNHE